MIAPAEAGMCRQEPSGADSSPRATRPAHSLGAVTAQASHASRASQYARASQSAHAEHTPYIPALARLAHPKVTPMIVIPRRLAGAPIARYRAVLGGLLTSRMVLLGHRGRCSGLIR